MSSEQNKAIVRRLIEEPWKGDLRVIDELVDRKYVGYDPSVPEPLRGPDGFKENVSTYREAYSDARITVDEQIAEGDPTVLVFEDLHWADEAMLAFLEHLADRAEGPAQLGGRPVAHVEPGGRRPASPRAARA